MTQADGGWIGRVGTPAVDVRARTRDGCLSKIRRAAGDDAVLTVELMPTLVGVAEAAAVMGWDKRRVVTYLDRGSFPAPVATLASGRVWRRDDVESFARSWRRKQQRKRGR